MMGRPVNRVEFRPETQEEVDILAVLQDWGTPLRERLSGKGNLSSIHLSEVDSWELAEMLALLT